MDTIDYKASFEQSSAIMVILNTDFTIVATSDSCLNATKTIRENVIGRDIFDVFPYNPNDITADGESIIRTSLNRVLKNKTTDTIAIIKYDIPKPESEGGGFEVKYWQSCHSPVLDEFNNVKYIIQRVEDVTGNETLIAQLEAEKRLLKQVSDSEKRYSMLLMKSPFAFAVFKGKEMVISVANDSMKKIWQKDGQIEGKPLFEVLPELKDTPFPGLLDNVYTTGIPFRGDDVLAQFQRGDKLEDSYYNFIYQPYLEADETISGVSAIVWEVTGQVLVKKALAQQAEAEKKALKSIEDSNKRYYKMLMESPFAFSVMIGKEMVITLANDLIKEFWGKGNDVEGKPLLDILPELKDQAFPAMIISVLSTGTPVYANEILAKLKHNDKMEDRYFNIVYQPYHEADGTISGVTTIAYDVTEMVLARKKLEESEYKYRMLIEESSIATALFLGPDNRILYANDTMLSYWAKDKTVIGKTMIEAIPELIGQPFISYLKAVYTTGIPYTGTEEKAEIIVNGKLQTFYFNYSYKALLDLDGKIYGINIMAMDATDQVLGQQKIKESELYFRQMADLMPANISNSDTEGNVLYFNKRWLDYTGLSFEELQNLGYHKIIHPDELEEFQKRFKESSDARTDLKMEMRFLDKNGEYKWHLNIASPVKDKTGNITMWVGSTTEIHDQKIVSEKIRDSEERFRRLVIQAPVAICVLRGKDYVIETINEPMVEMWDRKMQEVMNKPAFDVLTEFREQGLKELLDQVYNTGENIVVNEMLLNIKLNGALENIFVKFVYEPLREADGTITGVMALAHEITDQVIARKRIEESETLFKQLLDTMPQVAWTNTVEGEVTFYNQRWYDYTGLSKQKVDVLGCTTIIHHDDLKNTLDRYHSILKTSEGGEFQVRGKRSDGTYRWHLIRLMPLKNENGNVKLWMGTATDIQELKLLQQQKDDFISIASHELKTPITTLKASLQLLNKLKDNPANLVVPKLIGQANKSLDKVIVLMDDLLNASIANEGQLHINKKLVTLSQIIEDCCPHVRAEGIFNIKTEGDMDVKVYADAARIEQVVINFVNNAIKYAPGSKEIRIDIEKVDDMAKVSIIDKGPGIPPDKLLHLFDRFYRVDSSGSQYSGLGLGLYISSEIIKKHNGQIGVESELGKGSTFWFTLPVA